MDMDCPKCNGKLQSAKHEVVESSPDKDLQGADLQYEFEVEQCFVCGGVWFDKGKLESYLKQGFKAIHSPSMGAAMDKQLNAKKGKCPVCQIEMVQHPDSADHGVQVDTCTKCGGIWLDSTEIDRLEADEWKLNPKSLISFAVHALLSSRKKSSDESPEE